MKKLLLATAVATLSISAAQAAPTVYGKAFLTVDYTDDGDSSSTKLNSNSSRIGVKGAEALTANTDAVYQLEYGVDVDAADNGKKQFYSRDTYLGLANKQYGTLVAGRLTAIDDNINYANQAVGQFDNSFGGAAFDGNRVNNAFAYFSPDYSGMQFMAMYGLDADQDAGGLKDGGWGVGVKYEPTAQPFRAGATYIQSGDFNVARVSGGYDVNQQFGLGALYQIADNGVKGAKKENVLSVSGTMKTATPWTAYAQADFIKNVGFTDGDDNTQFVLGGKYGFNKNTTGHIYAGYHNLEQKGAKDQDGFGVGTGLEYKF